MDDLNFRRGKTAEEIAADLTRSTRYDEDGNKISDVTEEQNAARSTSYAAEEHPEIAARRAREAADAEPEQAAPTAESASSEGE